MKWFGTTLRDVSNAFAVHLDARTDSAAAAAGERTKAYAVITLSLVLMALGSYLLLFRDGDARAAGGSLIALVAGYWFR